MMRHGRRRLVVGMVVVALAFSVLPGATADEEPDPFQVLVVSKTTAFRHPSIVPATTTIMELGAEYGFDVDVWDPVISEPGYHSLGQPTRTLPSTPFTSAADLGQYETLVFVSTTDASGPGSDHPPLLDDTEFAALQGYIRDGGGFAGVHAATDAMRARPWYGELTGGGAYVRNQPVSQTALVRLESPAHPSTAALPPEWPRFDEWYNFTQNPRPYVHVLLTVDESTYFPGPGAMGDDHPIAWCHNFEGGRSWYTAGGHPNVSYSEPLFVEHLLQGILWSAGRVTGGGDCVTFYEVRNLVDDLAAMQFTSPADQAKQAAAVRNLTRKLDLAETYADAVDRDAAISQLNTAAGHASTLVPDSQVGAVLAGKLGNLVEWQQALQDAGM